MKVIVDSGPLVAAMDQRDPAHPMASHAIRTLRQEAVIPTPVLAEVDHLVRKRSGSATARGLMRSIARGTFETEPLTSGLLRRAVEIDARYADLELGLVDTAVMAIAERHRFPVFTFDFTDFRATESADGPWPLLLDENTYRKAIHAEDA